MKNTLGKVYLIPTILADDTKHTIPVYIIDCIKNCDSFFVETEKTTRRFFKSLWKEMVIDNYQWHTIHKAENAVKKAFIDTLKAGKNIGIVSEAGCPGIADPGQILIAAAQEIGATIKPLVGPSSILLALMASGLNGQQFMFNGYLPIDGLERKTKIKSLESYSQQHQCTQLFIETPYRNNSLLQDIIATCKPTTQLCIAADITSSNEFIVTKTIENWQKNLPELHKKPVIFLLLA